VSASATRATFPELCADADIIERRFGKTAMKYITNGTVTLGKLPTPGMDWFATTPYRRGM
jgi:hypothetical protein